MKPKQIFFDTEFSNFETMTREPKLISVGCVTADGREFYAELSDTYQSSDCSDFVLETVLPLLTGGEARMSEVQAADRLKRYIVGIGKEAQLMSDAPHYDWPLVKYLFDFYGWPENLIRKCGHVYFEHALTQRRYERMLAEYWVQHHERMHNALVDARSMQWASNRATKG